MLTVEHRAGHPLLMGPRGASFGSSSPAAERRWWLTLLAGVALLPALFVLFPLQDDSGVVYPVACVLYAAMGLVCLWNSRREGGWVRRAWGWMGVHCAALVFVYAVAAVGSWTTTGEAGRVVSWMETAAQMLAFGACLKAFLSGLADRDATQRVMDAVLLLMLCGLVFVTVSSTGPLGTRPCRVWIAPLKDLFLWGCSLAYRRAWTTRGHNRLARLVSGYLVLRTLATFACNVVSLWVPVSLREQTALDALFTLPMLWFVVEATRSGAGGGAAEDRTAAGGVAAAPAGALWLSMLPSMLFLACVGLALANAGRFPRGSVLLIGGVVVLFAARTRALSRRLTAEKMELLAASRAMEELATVDPLTGVRNRRWLEGEGTRLLQTAGELRAGLLLIDTDRFKEVNDTFGHAAGDALLLQLSGVIRQVLRGRPRAGCVRLGGDEFVVLLPGEDVVAAATVAEQLRQEVREILLPDRVRRVTVSVGVAATAGPVALGALMELADEALYRAKGRGRDRVELAEEDAVQFARSERHTNARRFRPETDAFGERGVVVAMPVGSVAADGVSPYHRP